MAQIRAAVVGSGGMAGRRARTLSEMPDYELASVAARNPETGPALANEHGVDLVTNWRDLLERPDIDALVVCTSNDSHGSIAIASLEAGKHVLSEYPLTRCAAEAQRLQMLIPSCGPVLRLTHREPISGSHRELKACVQSLGALSLATFLRLTPGRGARPEVLFNLPATGPPALFFVYHVYPLVDLFGPIAWVESSAEYGGLTDGGRYDRFTNTLTAGFERGGTGTWAWAGGIEIEKALETQRMVMAKGTLLRGPGGWQLSTRGATEPLPDSRSVEPSLEQVFLEDVTSGSSPWRADAQLGLHAAQVGLAAEVSAREGRRVVLSEIA